MNIKMKINNTHKPSTPASAKQKDKK